MRYDNVQMIWERRNNENNIMQVFFLCDNAMLRSGSEETMKLQCPSYDMMIWSLSPAGVSDNRHTPHSSPPEPSSSCRKHYSEENTGQYTQRRPSKSRVHQRQLYRSENQYTNTHTHYWIDHMNALEIHKTRAHKISSYYLIYSCTALFIYIPIILQVKNILMYLKLWYYTACRAPLLLTPGIYSIAPAGQLRLTWALQIVPSWSPWVSISQKNS